ncbi:MAG TPA: response regulator transcription factor [Candidatus Dormibacteraeota bacterium]|jgi:DNA-binding response OmpR family regulator
MARVMVVEDEADMNNLIRDHLTAEGHEVDQAFDGRTALALAQSRQHDLVILDWMLPDLDGLAVCRRLREDHLMPIIMLTARTEEVDRVLGLEVGADDYVPKPFSMRELLARARAALRRVALESQRGAVAVSVGPAPIVHGALRIDPGAHAAELDGEPLHLTPKEYDLLVLFTTHPGRAFSRDFLLERIWDGDYEGFDRAIDTHIRRLRRKLGPLGDAIVTVWGVGYRFVPQGSR